MELRQEKGAQGNADANSQSGEQIEYQAVGALRAKMPLEATDHQAKQGSHQTIRHGTAEKQGAASCGQRAAQVDQQWLGGFCRDLGNFPAQLSGGEQQRVAIARALVNNPATIIADEPTGNLDPERSMEIMTLLVKINQLGTTVVVVTHEKDLVNKFGKRVITIDQGRIINDSVGGYVGGHIHE